MVQYVTDNQKASLNQAAFKKDKTVDTTTNDSSSGSLPNIKDTSQSMLTYPKDLIGNSTAKGANSFMVFRAYETKSVTRAMYGNVRSTFDSRKSQSNSSIAAIIALNSPLIQEQLSHDFGEHDSSPIKDLIGNVSNDFAGKGSIFQKIQNARASIMNHTQNVGGAVVGNIVRSAIEANSAQQLKRNGTVAADYASVTSFKGTSLRTQTFTYQFNPRSLNELKVVANIIKTFYRLSLATRTSAESPIRGWTPGEEYREGFAKYATLLKTPPIWMIEEVSNVEDSNNVRYIPRFVFGPAGISSIRLNRTPDSYWKTFKGTAGDPTSIELEITFNELIPMDRGVYDNDLKTNISTYKGSSLE